MILLCSDNNDLISRWRQGIPGSLDTVLVKNLEELNVQLNGEQSSIVLFDLELLDGDISTGGVELIQRYSDIRIIAMSPMPDTDEGLSLIAKGAKGYCNRYIAPEMLSKVLAVVAMGEVWLGNSLVNRLLENLAKAGQAQNPDTNTQKSDQRLTSLTYREQEIAGLVGSGASNKIIARELDITERTVKAHLSAIFRKTQTKDRLQLSLIINSSSL
ncbi:MAG: response regulator transcription factor [Gammaproteobacteria bacterium]|nr:response regulator transcription factor [Gammaproteobacteria bacterium]